jgi:hypothetical protein
MTINNLEDCNGERKPGKETDVIDEIKINS